MRIDKEQVEESLRKGIVEILRYVEKVEKPISFETIVFGLSEELGDLSWVINPFVSQLELCRKAKEVWLTTIDGKCYMKAAVSFNEALEEMFKKNEIYLN